MNAKLKRNKLEFVDISCEGKKSEVQKLALSDLVCLSRDESRRKAKENFCHLSSTSTAAAAAASSFSGAMKLNTFFISFP